MRVLVIGNFSDGSCGFRNFSEQTVVALTNAGMDVTAWDGTYSVVYARREANILKHYFLPDDAADYDVIHIVWHPATMNHYSGCEWPAGPVLSEWNGCPQASCPFHDRMTVRWTVLESQLGDHRWAFYPIPDWVTDLPEPDPVFTVGWSGIRGDGLGELTEVCAKRGWATNFSQKGVWLPLEDEVRRLARSTVNVCWYSAANDDRSGAVAVCLASHRPQLVNRVRMFAHLASSHDIYHGVGHHKGIDTHVIGTDLETALASIERDADNGDLRMPDRTLKRFSWSTMARRFRDGWMEAKR